MPSLIDNLLAMTALAFLTTASAIPTSNDLAKRADLTWPGIDEQIYTGPKGGRWKISCNTDTQQNGYISKAQTNGFEDCIILCGATTDCRFATWNGYVTAPNPCYLEATSWGNVPGKGVKLVVKQK